ncbi:deoxyribodipyrimidine photo-lyase [Pseudoalteromonas rubra]|uniref:Deoxyribodipyrimidine photo-lyase n=1 Tax=Pseudoalteromonas rubra TaxID=43658 RepID=A0A5S3UZH5_9GAMM|nr:deoxyribodipyrimidine photo-lyase [Pseudoalteromonas rubra]QPB85231.1 deoxyribodipyrimidine photo-lyase [Pseudoalteromonas rubra]
MSTLFWFRRDLRVFGNEALIAAVENGARDALFLVCEQQWQAHNAAPVQVDLLKRRVIWLGHKLAELGVRLHVLDAGDFTQVPAVVSQFCQENGVAQVYANREYEVNEQDRDNACQQAGVQLQLFDGDLIAPPGSVTTASNEMYKVFTPFKKAWLKQYEQKHFYLPGWPEINAAPFEWEAPELLTGEGVSDKWPVDDETLVKVVQSFIQEKMVDYKANRDFPGVKGTSGLSPYLALGIVSVKQLLAESQLHFPELLQMTSAPAFSWINELIWREFYRHLICAYPKLCKGVNFNEKYNHVDWRQDDAHFKAWCEGNTGYPIVDAAMRQLNQTGWMHNRLRMIVASFLTKHLLIDWRKGEHYFMSKLIDGDLASNNGGWQWAASTGCDAQPYFRIFNPISQSEKFDPQGDFIRKFVPELSEVPAKSIHFPHDYMQAFGISGYMKPIVDHKAARERALAAFKV